MCWAASATLPRAKRYNLALIGAGGLHHRRRWTHQCSQPGREPWALAAQQRRESVGQATDSKRCDGTDWRQLAHYQRNLLILAEGGVGSFSRGLVCGNLIETFTGLIYQTGFRRPVANYVAGRSGGLVDPD